MGVDVLHCLRACQLFCQAQPENDRVLVKADRLTLRRGSLRWRITALVGARPERQKRSIAADPAGPTGAFTHPASSSAISEVSGLKRKARGGWPRAATQVCFNVKE